MQKKPVPYQPSDGHGGLQISAGEIRAFREDSLVDASPVNPWADLGEMLGDYAVLQNLPRVEFTLNGEIRLFDVVVTMEFIVGSEINGWVWINGKQFPWAAIWTRDAIFGKQKFLPDGAREYAKDDPPFTGWKITLPNVLRTFPDPVFVTRLSVVIEEFLYAVEKAADSNDEDLNDLKLFSKTIDNVMSDSKPMWNIELPKIDD